MLQFTLTFIKNIKSGKHTEMDADPNARLIHSRSHVRYRASLDSLSLCLMSIALLGESSLVRFP